MIGHAELFKLVSKALNRTSHMDLLDKVSHDQALQNLHSVTYPLLFNSSNLQKSHDYKWLTLGYIPDETCLVFEEARQESSPFLRVKLLNKEHLLDDLAALDKYVLVLLLANRENELLVDAVEAFSGRIGLTVATWQPLITWIVTDDHFVARLSLKNFKIFQERRSKCMSEHGLRSCWWIGIIKGFSEA